MLVAYRLAGLSALEGHYPAGNPVAAVFQPNAVRLAGVQAALRVSQFRSMAALGVSMRRALASRRSRLAHEVVVSHFEF
jgi:hypothetical protein